MVSDATLRRGGERKSRLRTVGRRAIGLVRAEGFEPSQALRPNGFSYHLRLSPPPSGVCGLDYPFTLASRRRCCPSSLYTFPFGMFLPGLARDCHFTGFPEFEQFCIAGFPASTQVAIKSGASADSATPA